MTGKKTKNFSLKRSFSSKKAIKLISKRDVLLKIFEKNCSVAYREIQNWYQKSSVRTAVAFETV